MVAQIHAVQEPVELGAGNPGDVPRPEGGPGKAGLLQLLLPQTEARALPVQDLDLVPGAVAEHEQLAAERIQRQLGFHQGSQAGAPKMMEWYGAFGLTITLIWLYIEILRLLSLIAGRE